jgi:hypothetical protein
MASFAILLASVATEAQTRPHIVLYLGIHVSSLAVNAALVEHLKQ